MGKHETGSGKRSTYEQNGGFSTGGGGAHRKEAGSDLPPRDKGIKDKKP